MEKVEERTIDEILDRITEKGPAWKYMLMVFSMSVVWIAHPPITYIPVFAGIMPSETDWICETQKCTDLVKINGTMGALCMKQAIEHNSKSYVLNSSEILWNSSRTSFVVDLDLYCEEGTTKKTLVSSFYFVGALCGLITGGYVFDNLGRKRGALFGTSIAIVITLSGTFCKNYYYLIAIRLLQGFGNFLSGTGMFILVMEVLPTKYRNYVNAMMQFVWAMGYPIASAIGYFIPSWNYIFLASSITLLVASIPILFAIESPRFYLINQKNKSSKDALKTIAKLNNIEINFEKIKLVDAAQETKRQQSFMQQIKEFCYYPKFLMETLIQMFLWFVVAMSYYGFNFGWGSIVPDLYVGYLLAAVGEIIAYLGVVPIIHFFGRRTAIMATFVLAGIFYLIAIPNVNLGSNWTLESIACLVGLVFVTGAFSLIYLYTGELAPTSHRGMVFCLSSSAARVGSFMGPFIFNSLFDVTHKAVPLGILALLAFFCAGGSFLLVETGGKSVPSVPADVQERRRDFSYRILSKQS